MSSQKLEIYCCLNSVSILGFVKREVKLRKCNLGNIMYAVMLYVDKKGSKALEILEILDPPCSCFIILFYSQTTK